MKELFVPKSFQSKSVDIIDKANEIIAEYQADGFTLTLRQLYYQFVARGLIKNLQTEYKRLGSIISDARLAGLIDWSAIEDRTRFLRRTPSWASPRDIVQACADQFKIDPWKDQDNYVEVWIEKDALVGVIEPVCERWRLPYFACRGYASQSEQYTAGKRVLGRLRAGKAVTIFHLGDHDPSGLDMTRDNQDRLGLFALSSPTVVRLALNWDQVQRYDPPPNPAKETDSRADSYVARYGHSSWELDALDPHVIDDLIENAVVDLVDGDAWEASMEEEREGRDRIQAVVDGWQ